MAGGSIAVSSEQVSAPCLCHLIVEGPTTEGEFEMTTKTRTALLLVLGFCCAKQSIAEQLVSGTWVLEPTVKASYVIEGRLTVSPAIAGSNRHGVEASSRVSTQLPPHKMTCDEGRLENTFCLVDEFSFGLLERNGRTIIIKYDDPTWCNGRYQLAADGLSMTGADTCNGSLIWKRLDGI